jgi:hypothetical protein
MYQPQPFSDEEMKAMLHQTRTQMNPCATKAQEAKLEREVRRILSDDNNLCRETLVTMIVERMTLAEQAEFVQNWKASVWKEE